MQQVGAVFSNNSVRLTTSDPGQVPFVSNSYTAKFFLYYFYFTSLTFKFDFLLSTNLNLLLDPLYCDVLTSDHPAECNLVSEFALYFGLCGVVHFPDEPECEPAVPRNGRNSICNTGIDIWTIFYLNYYSIFFYIFRRVQMM